MWGQAIKLLTLSDIAGIIPTRVGTRSFLSSSARVPRDHPHACGDKLACLSIRIFSRGSSPRVWGQVWRYGKEVIKMRIIPTRVGTSFINFKVNLCQQDHPHACGDKLSFLSSSDTYTGSSPRVWGQVLFTRLASVQCGIIPTRVGTSCYRLAYRPHLRDHPHACGDKRTTTL